MFGATQNSTLAAVTASGDVTGADGVGGLTGLQGDGSLTGGSASGDVGGEDGVGGLVGVLADDTITDSSASGDVSGEDGVGGLVGTTVENVTVSTSSASGDVSGGNAVGGLVGFNGFADFDAFGDQNGDQAVLSAESFGTVAAGDLDVGTDTDTDTDTETDSEPESTLTLERSAATGNVMGAFSIGGLVGANTEIGVVNGSYAVGAVEGERTGGLIGNNTGADTDTITHSYWDTETSGQNTSEGGIGLETAQMTGQNVTATMDGFDFDDVWVPTEDYPQLAWQYFDQLAGDGTAEDPYVITDIDELQAIEADLEANYTLGNDIDASETAGWNNGSGFQPIGTQTPFTGTFEGDGYTISGLFIDRQEEGTPTGLFGVVDDGAGLFNITIADVTVRGDTLAGGLVGLNAGVIDSVSIDGTVDAGSLVGGVTGFNDAVVIDSESSGTVNGTILVGGLAGLNTGVVLDSHSRSDVDGETVVGGFAGLSDELVLDSSAGGTVNGTNVVGGFVGEHAGLIVSSTADGSVRGEWAVGGLVGDNTDSLIANSAATGSVDGTAGVGGLAGYHGHTELEEEDPVEVLSTGTETEADEFDLHATLEDAGIEYDEDGVDFTDTDSVSFGDSDFDSDSEDVMTAMSDEVDDEPEEMDDEPDGDGLIISSYAVGTVTGDTDVGGLIGNNTDTVTNAYWDTEATTQSASDGGIGLETAQMTGQNATANMDGFAFNSAWIPTAGYPQLAWQYFDQLEGDGTTDDPYILTDIDELQAIEADLEANYTLGNDIDASETAGWNDGAGVSPIGATPDASFNGTLNGDGHTISALHIDRENNGFAGIGLFGVTGQQATVEHVHLEGASVNGQELIGALVGYNTGTVTDSSATGATNGSEAAGGLLGINTATGTVTNSSANVAANAGFVAGGLTAINIGTVTDSSAGGAVSADDGAGGFAGLNIGTVTDSHASGEVTGEVATGGFVGLNMETVANSSASGPVDGRWLVGGFAGENDGTVLSSSASGTVSGEEVVGGLVGENYFGSINNSVATGAVNGTGAVGGLVGVNGIPEVNGGDPIVSTQSTDTGADLEEYGADAVGGDADDAVSAMTSGENTDADADTDAEAEAEGGVTASYAIGPVNGDIDVGGLVGYNTATVTDSYWDTETSGQNTSAGGVGLETDQMTGQNATANMDGFAFYDTWVPTEAYPQLAWQYFDALPGNGVADDPYVLTDIYELQAIEADLEANYTLGADIDATETHAWNDGAGVTPIGTAAPFTGAINGNGHTITDLHIDREETVVGLFRQTADQAYLGQLTLENATVRGDSVTGGLVGINDALIHNSRVDGTVHGDSVTGGLVGINIDDGAIANSHVTGTVVGDELVGGLAGINVLFGLVTESSVNASVTGTERVGGAVGANPFAAVTDSTASGTVDGVELVGGLVADNGNGVVVNTASSASVIGDSAVGGLIGSNGPLDIDELGAAETDTDTDSDELASLEADDAALSTLAEVMPADADPDPANGSVELSYAVGTVTADTDAGGLVGTGTGAVTDSYWDTEATNQTASDGGVGLETAQMTGQNATANMDGFVFNTTWVATDDYPGLVAQLTGLELSPAEPTLTVGATTDVTVTASLADGSAVTASQTASYNSSDTAVVTADAGTLEGHSAGTTTVTATVGPVSDSVEATVSRVGGSGGGGGGGGGGPAPADDSTETEESSTETETEDPSEADDTDSGTETAEPTPSDPEDDDTIPGFGLTAALLALLSIALLSARRQRKG